MKKKIPNIKKENFKNKSLKTQKNLLKHLKKSRNTSKKRLQRFNLNKL